jgi:membrane-associated phospholipid phosphatase
VPGGFNAAALAFLLTATTAHAFFLFFPTTMDRAALPPDGFFVDLVRFVYENDKPVNLFPSLHVAYTFLANGVLFHVHRRLAWWMVPVSVLIVLSTVFLKQHLLIDIVGGMMTGVLAYLVFKRVYAVQTTAAR